MPDIQLGYCSSDALEFTLEKIEDSLRIFLVNADESGSMERRMDDNVSAYEKVAAVIGQRADIVILHGFESDSHYDIIIAQTARARVKQPEQLLRDVNGTLFTAQNPLDAVRLGWEQLKGHVARGTTNPVSHPKFLARLGILIDQLGGEVELIVLNSSDGGFDGGPKSAMTQAIDSSMRLVTARCRCALAANVLVGSAGSPDALSFFTGDSERYENRLLFSTVASEPGVLRLGDFDPAELRLSDGEGPRYTMTPPLACWTVSDEGRLLSWEPAGPLDAPPRVTLRKYVPMSGRRMVLRTDISPTRRVVTLDRDGASVFALIARSLSDNPYLREASRQALNSLIAPLESLLAKRASVLATLTASPEAQARVTTLRSALESNTADIRAVLSRNDLTAGERASRCNALNNVRHVLKAELRAASEALAQETLEKEFGFYEAHPHHWLLWLEPSIGALKAQLGLTQADPGDKMAHLSTRIRTAKSSKDGQSRAADRYVDRLLAESRARRDHLERKHDPRDELPLEAPAHWLDAACPITGRPLAQGLGAIPFVADRSDLTTGNIMSGGQNVDRMPIDDGPMLSLVAVRELMWGELGQMASPFHSAGRWYNAAIPVLIGPASDARLRDLERAIGWLSTGTTAFAPQMAEALPGALAVLLGDPTDAPNTSPQVQALLRTSALLSHYRSYPYAPGTAVFDESRPKESLTSVWAKSLADAALSACLQSMGCITSLFARAVAADSVEPDVVTEDLFAWACRNIARSVLMTSSTDGRGGVEGICRLAALLHCAVELDGFPLEAPSLTPRPETPPELSPDGTLERDTLAWVLGPLYDETWALRAPVQAATFTDTLNLYMSGLPRAELERIIPSLDGVFARLDSLSGEALTPLTPDMSNLATPPTSGMTARPHFGFDDSLALGSLRPTRHSTAVPGLTSPKAQVRRMTKAHETRWCPPPDAGLAENPSAFAFLESHSALMPVRAWLRLVDAGLVGRPALAALRSSPLLHPIPSLPQVLPRLAERLGGMAKVLAILRRSFAFVVANANGYADNQWSTSPLRTASAEDIDAILGERPKPVNLPRDYGASDTLDLSLDEQWPRMDARGYLPKSRAVGRSGQTIRPPPRLTAEEASGSDERVCQRASAVMLADLAASELTHVTGGLHRAARRVLGEHSVDLSTLSDDARLEVILHELVPVLAGRARTDLAHLPIFEEYANVLNQMAALGVDTRTLRAEEPKEFLAAEARAIRAMAK